MNQQIEIRADDVLQTTHFTKSQLKSFRGGKTWFDYFLEVDKVFEKYDCMMVLAICTEGIETEKEWVEHIKKNIHRYKIELHGTKHYAYRDFNEVDGEKDLREGIRLLEETFGQKVTTWYPPFGGKYVPEWADRVCKRIGIEHNAFWLKHGTDLWLLTYRIKGYPSFKKMNFHFWYEPQRREVEEIVKILCQ